MAIDADGITQTLADLAFCDDEESLIFNMSFERLHFNCDLTLRPDRNSGKLCQFEAKTLPILKMWKFFLPTFDNFQRQHAHHRIPHALLYRCLAE